MNHVNKISSFITLLSEDSLAIGVPDNVTAMHLCTARIIRVNIDTIPVGIADVLVHKMLKNES